MKTWTLLLVVVMMAVVMAVVAMEEEEEEDNDDWLENMMQEYKRRPRPPPPNLSSRTQCIGYAKTCTIKNRRHNCCHGMGCYRGNGDNCYGKSGCVCMKRPALRYIYNLG